MSEWFVDSDSRIFTVNTDGHDVALYWGGQPGVASLFTPEVAVELAHALIRAAISASSYREC